MTKSIQLVTGTGLDILDCEMGECQGVGVGTTGEGGQRIHSSCSVTGSRVKMHLAYSPPFWGSGSGFSVSTSFLHRQHFQLCLFPDHHGGSSGREGVGDNNSSFSWNECRGNTGGPVNS